MNIPQRTKILLTAIYIIVAGAATPMMFAQEAKLTGFSEYVDAEGNISLPENFELDFAHLGTIAVAKRDQPVSELHITYTRPEDIKGFQENGIFQDGAILVKQVKNVTKQKLTTGHTSFEADLKVWFVMVKDSQNRFPNNKLWADGWGWALFKNGDRKTQTAKSYRANCRSCHVPAAKTDRVFTQCYPLLNVSAEPEKESDPSDTDN